MKNYQRILTVYMRTKGMVPPSTERGMKGRADDAPGKVAAGGVTKSEERKSE